VIAGKIFSRNDGPAVHLEGIDRFQK